MANQAKAMKEDLIRDFYIPPRPKLLEDIREADGDLRLIGSAISQEPGVSSQVLIMVNSPMFGLVKKVASVEQAVMILGGDIVNNIVNTVMLRSVSSDVDTGFLDMFWQNSINVASISRWLSKHLSVSPPEEAYTLGLFHNCGIPLAVQKYPEYIDVMKQSYHDEDCNLCAIEEEHIGANHAVISYLVSKTWMLPEFLCNIILDHHNCDGDTFSQANDVVSTNALAILKLAEHLCQLYRHLGKADTDYEWLNIRDTLLEYLGLSDLDYEEMKESIYEELSDILGDIAPD